MIINNVKPGDIVTYKPDPGSLYMVTKREGKNIYCIGANSDGLLETNHYSFANLGSVTFGPEEHKKYYKKVNMSYEKGSYFDYLYKVIVEKSTRILVRPKEHVDYINYIQQDNNIWIDPTKNVHEEYYKPYFGEDNGIRM